MSLALLYPLGLLALAALLLPVLIHLARRQQYAPLDFAALRWLRARVRPRRRVRVDEWLLLLVRLLLLTALAVLLARPVLRDAAIDLRPVSVVAPGLQGMLLRGQDNDGDWRWLAPGFPALQEAPPVTAQPLASLLRELDQALPAGVPLVVFVPDPMHGLDGERIRLSRPVQWRLVALPVATSSAVRPALRLRVGGSGEPSTLQILDALQRAWTDTPLDAAGSADAAPSAGQVGVWLSAAALPPSWQAWLDRGGTVLRVTAPEPGAGSANWWPALRDARGATLLEQRAQGRGRLLRFTAALSIDALPSVADAAFPRQLQDVLQPMPVPAVGVATEQTPLTGAAAPAAQPRDLAPWLMLMIVLLFALERWLATSARRRGER